MYLNCHTSFSLRYGVIPPAQLVQRAADWGIQSLALTDINNTSAAGEFLEHCRKAGIHGVLGIDFRDEAGQQLYIGLARNRTGWRELNDLLTGCSLRREPLPLLPPPLANVWIIFPRLVKPIDQFRPNELLGIRPEHVARLFNHDLLRHPRKLVALAPVTFLDDEDYQLHQLLRAIDRNTVLPKLTPADLAKKSERLLAPEGVETYYRQYPHLIRNTNALLQHCQCELETGLHVNRQTFTGSKASDFSLLEKLAVSGCRRRYGDTHPGAHQRLLRELQVIRQHDFCAYFLITWDIVRYAESAGFHHIGRGSGANSIVAYCLGISDVDPLELNLYFERFINPHRSSPPDFDIDFSWDERDDITDYVFKRYGRDHVALLATYSTFQHRAALRELGKVFGLPKADIDRLSESTGPPLHELAPTIYRYAEQLAGLPSHLSIHAGGVIISEEPLAYHTASQLMPKGFPVTHIDMHHAEALGFHKFDLLSQRGLGHIKDTVELVRQRYERTLNIHDISRLQQDEGALNLLRSARCLGCFYIESPAMRGLLQKLHCDNYPQLVAASSIIRPGVARSGMMREYIRRSHDPQGVTYLHPVFAEQLGETHGIMVYQEDVMKIVHHFAGLDLGESDILRRIMSGKKYTDDTLERLQQKYLDNCRQRGYAEALIQEVWRQIESFAGYSFCKAHSASYAVESFQSLFLKAHYPLEFITAVINNFGGFYRTEYYVHEARLLGAQVHAPCVNHSKYLSSLQNAADLYLGFVHLHQLERQVAQAIVQQRTLHGPFRGLEDFVQRVPIRADQLDILIRIGAFRFTGRSKYELLWEKGALLHPGAFPDDTPGLFTPVDKTLQILPGLPVEQLQEGPYDQAFDEIELLGFPLRSPFELLAAPWQHFGGPTAADLPRHKGRPIRLLGYYVCQKTLRTVNGQRMAFGTWLDHQGAYLDTTHFPNFLQQHPFRGKGIYLLEGQVAEEFGFYSLEVTRMERLPFIPDARLADE